MMREHGTQRSLSEAATPASTAGSPEWTLDHTGLGAQGRPDSSMGYVDPASISPVVREYFWDDGWPRLSPYFERKDYHIFVEAAPYEALIESFPDEVPIYEEGYLWCTCYSTDCLDGESGHHHMSVLTPITPERFRVAQARGWHL